MNRRKTIKNLMMASAGMVALPAWAQGWTPGNIPVFSLGPSFLSAEGEDMIRAVADTIIPRTDAIGALDVKVDTFLTKLFAACYEEEIQQNISLQLRALDASARETFGQPFTECNQAQREGLLLGMATSEDTAQADFFTLIKGETIRGFMTSREVLRDYEKYVVAPGHYHGCVPITSV